MNINTIKTYLLQNAINIPGWSTRRKIIVIESDDWGSIRMSSKHNRDELVRKGFDFDNQQFNKYDALESNDDLSALFTVLRNHKDSKGNQPIFTTVSIVANPDFEKIEAGNFQNYHFEPFTETLKRYPSHNQVADLYKQGIKENLFYPVFHGREHLNVTRWLKALQNGNKSIRTTFNHRVTAVHLGQNNEFLGDFQAAFDVDDASDLVYLETVLTQGLDLFENIWGYKSRYFVPANGPFNNSLEKLLAENGVRYILGERIQNEPLGNGHYKKHFHYLGMQNQFQQTYLTRNAVFEPTFFADNQTDACIAACLKSIERAFRWHKPATISTHRLNYIGFIEENNRTRNLLVLNKLLTEITNRWPDVEFMTSVELGDLIAKEKDCCV